MRKAFAIILLVGCATTPMRLHQWWVPGDTVARTAVPVKDVVVLPGPPGRPFAIIGYVDASVERFKSRGEAINDMRAVAAHYGAQAVYEDRGAGPDTSVTLTAGAAPPRLVAIVWR